LGQPLARAEYLLRLRGAVDGGLEDEEAVVGDDDDDDEAMLLEVMEVRERAEEAETAEEVEVQRAENRVRMDEAVGVLEEAFARDELGRARREVVRLRYWVGVEDRLREGHGGH
jgi:molecular chaperone HscB